ncbi:hypothetical protein Bbelb_407670 [Branchiostoma belcheri]|nr:hypothetical protein Bbelb_407670 [Branchiostoma belcheri]
MRAPQVMEGVAQREASVCTSAPGRSAEMMIQDIFSRARGLGRGRPDRTSLRLDGAPLTADIPVSAAASLGCRRPQVEGYNVPARDDQAGDRDEQTRPSIKPLRPDSFCDVGRGVPRRLSIAKRRLSGVLGGGDMAKIVASACWSFPKGKIASRPLHAFGDGLGGNWPDYITLLAIIPLVRSQESRDPICPC